MGLELDIEQFAREDKYSKKGLVNICKKVLKTELGEGVVNILSSKVKEYLCGKYWQSKQEYITAICLTDISSVDIAEQVVITTLRNEETTINTVANEIGSLFEQYIDDVFMRVQIGADIIIACNSLIYDLDKKDEVIFKSRLVLDDNDKLEVSKYMYLPPMVVQPLQINSNNQSGYYTFNNSVILGGKYKQHNKPVRLDVINILNKIGFVIDKEVAKNIELPKELPEGQDLINYIVFIAQQQMLIKEYEDKTFYFNHKLDSRQRIYSQGHHLQYQGTEYRKALVSLAKAEIVNK